MKFIVSLVVAIAIAVPAARPFAAEPVPDHATGIWSTAECDGDDLTVLLDTNAALMFETQGDQTLVAMARAEWLADSIVLMVDGDAGELVLPPLDGLKRCAELPVVFSLMFAESITLFREIDELQARCSGEDAAAAQCAALAFELIDISEDGVFSRAEISRAVRAVSFFIGYGVNVAETQEAFVPMEKMTVAWFSASVLGPFIATYLIDSYDFDGDERLSLRELLQDRSPEQGIEGLAAGLTTQVPPGMMSGLVSTVHRLLGVLP